MSAFLILGLLARKVLTLAAAVHLATGLMVGAMAAAPAATSAGGRKDVADMDIAELVKVRVSPFEVSSALDKGYRASNSVTGSRFDTPIRDLPFAIQAFTQAFIKDQKPVNLFDVARYSPGVTYRSNDFNEGNANLAIRGFVVSAVPGSTQVLRDGFQGPSILDFTNVSRVEVVKGPASFLYGQVAPGGIVNVITKSPQPRFAATADATSGSYGQHRVDVDVTGPVSPTLFFRLAASHDQDMHYWDPYDARSRNISPSLLWQPNGRVSLSLKYENFRKVESPQLMQKPAYGRHSGAVPTALDPNRLGIEVPGLPDNWNSMSHADFRRSDTRSLSAWIDFQADDRWNLRAGYSRQAYEIDAIFSGNLGMANNTTFLQGRRVRAQTYGNRGETFEAEMVGKLRFGDTSVRVLLGAQLVNRSFDNRAGQAANDPSLGNNPTASPLPLWDLRNPATWDRDATIARSALTQSAADRDSQYRDKSVYVGTTFGIFSDRMLLLSGWRLTSTKNRQVNHLTNSQVDQADILSARMVTPQFGVLYKVNPDLSLFASYAKSFVPGSQLLTDSSGTLTPPAPTRGKGFDIGLKTEAIDGRVSGTLTFFDLRNKNIVNDFALTNATGAVAIYSAQSGEQRSRGFELDTTISPTDNWQLYFSYSYMRARIVEFSGNDAAVLAQDPTRLDAAGQANYRNVSLLHNAPLQMSAPHLANIWTRHNFVSQGLRGAYVGGGVNMVANQTIFADAPPATRQTYTLVNALVGYTWASDGRRISAELMGKNLTNQVYRPSQSTRSRPREWLFTVKAAL